MSVLGTRGNDPSGGVLRRLLLADHRDVGRGFLVLAVLGGLLGGALSLLVRLRLPVAAPLDAAAVWHGAFLLFFCVTPALLGGFGTWLVPPMIGASRTAAPALSRLSLVLMVAAFLLVVHGLLRGLDAGMAAVPAAVAVWSLAVLLGAADIVATVLNMRTRTMRLLAVPPFVWCQFAAALLLLLSLPLLLAFLTLHPATDPATVAQLFGTFALPVLAAILLPAAGAVSEIVATFSGRPLRFRSLLTVAGLVGGPGLFTVWAHGALSVTPGGEIGGVLLTGSAFAGAVLLCWLSTLRPRRGGRVVPLLWAAGAVALLAATLLAEPLLRLSGASGGRAAEARLHGEVLLFSAFAGLGAFFYWFGKLFGREYPEGPARLQFLLCFAGAALTVLPQLGAPAVAEWLLPFGVLLSVLSLPVFLFVLLRAALDRRPAVSNPWGAGAVTPEWQLPSPLPAAAPEHPA